MSRDLLITVEGHGEVAAAANLVTRVLAAQGHTGVFPAIRKPVRFKLDGPGGVELACEYARAQSPGGLLITSDWEDGCPSQDAPSLAERVRCLDLPFPVAVVLFYREYETLALSVADRISGKSMTVGKITVPLAADVSAPASPEGPRDAKGWVSKNLMEGQRYKPTVHQLPLTRLLQPADLRAADLPSFRRLERAVHHLATSASATTTAVYPHPERPA